MGSVGSFWTHICAFESLKNGLFQKFFVTPLLRITIFSHTPPGILSHFSPPPPPPWNSTPFFLAHPPGIPRKSVIINYDPLEFSNFKHNPLEFSRFSFLRPPWNFRYPQQGGSGKFLEQCTKFVFPDRILHVITCGS